MFVLSRNLSSVKIYEKIMTVTKVSLHQMRLTPKTFLSQRTDDETSNLIYIRQQTTCHSLLIARNLGEFLSKADDWLLIMD